MIEAQSTQTACINVKSSSHGKVGGIYSLLPERPPYQVKQTGAMLCITLNPDSTPSFDTLGKFLNFPVAPLCKDCDNS